MNNFLSSFDNFLQLLYHKNNVQIEKMQQLFCANRQKFKFVMWCQLFYIVRTMWGTMKWKAIDRLKFVKFFWGYYRGFEAWFCRFSGGRGGVYALRLKAFQPCCFWPLWLLSVRLLAFIGCIVSIYTDNKYYVTSPLFCLLAYVYMFELLTPLKWLANRLKFNFKAG